MHMYNYIYISVSVLEVDVTTSRMYNIYLNETCQRFAILSCCCIHSGPLRFSVSDYAVDARLLIFIGILSTCNKA